MWDRKILKMNAKTALRGRYWLAFAVALVACILAGRLFAGGMNPLTLNETRDVTSRIEEQFDRSPYDRYDDDYYDYGDYYDDFWDDAPYYGYDPGYGHGHGYDGYPYGGDAPWETFAGMGGLAVLILVVGLFAAGIGLAFRFFVSNPIHMGECRYFVHNRFGDTRFEHLFGAFRAGYLTSVGAMCTTDLLIEMWLYLMLAVVVVSTLAILGGAYMASFLILLSLLLLIPYVVKTYQYCFVKYLLADNPQLKGTRARQISTILTGGEKGSIFVLDLSFLGWYLLGTLCLGLGRLFVNPYYAATKAELYIFLRDRAIQNGLLDPAELCLVPGGIQPPPPPQNTAYMRYNMPPCQGPSAPYGAPPPAYPGGPVPPVRPQGPAPYGTTPPAYPGGPSAQRPQQPYAPSNAPASPQPDGSPVEGGPVGAAPFQAPVAPVQPSSAPETRQPGASETAPDTTPPPAPEAPAQASHAESMDGSAPEASGGEENPYDGPTAI